MRKLLVILMMVLVSMSTSAQVYMTKKGAITFYSSAPMEDIKATSNQVTSALNLETGSIVFVMLVKTFQFKKAMMQEHFNENYVESHKYPKAKFSGKIINLEELTLDKPGTYTAEIKGKMTIHGVTRDVETKGTLTVTADQIKGNAKFNITVKDYDIKIPKMMVKNIAEVVEVTVVMNYLPKVD
jgi:hypothetical protein